MIAISDGTVAGKYSTASSTVNFVSNGKLRSSKMSRAKTFSETIRPILLLNILFGTGSFVVSKKQKVRKCVESVYAVVVWITYNLFIQMHITCREAFVKPKIQINSFLIVSWISISYQVMTVLIFVTKFKTKVTQDLIEAVDKINEKMQTIGLPNQEPTLVNHRIYHLCAWLTHTVAIVMATWKFRIDSTAPTMEKIALTFGSNISLIMLLTVQLSFAFWIEYIRMKFSQLNRLLEEMIVESSDHSSPKRFLAIPNSKKRRRPNVHAVNENVETITKAKNYHLDLIKIAKRINKFYGMQLLLTLFILFFTIIILLYIFNYFIWQPIPMSEIFKEVFPVVISLIITMLRMIHLHCNCMQITNEASKAGFLLCRMYNSSASIQFRAEIQHFTQQVLANPLVINVCGLVDIDHTFLSSVVGSIFTYLIVIVQLAWPQVQRRQYLAANTTDVNVAANYTGNTNFLVSNQTYF